jgi:3-oxoacyl-[acyl-carrier protein] reductase
VLVNNAGIAAMNHLLLTPLSTVQRIFATNVFGTFVAMRECAKVMMAKRYGRIVNFATVATPLNLEGEATYAASKAAVESFTRVAARELAPFNITVNAVGPDPSDDGPDPHRAEAQDGCVDCHAGHSSHGRASRHHERDRLPDRA